MTYMRIDKKKIPRTYFIFNTVYFMQPWSRNKIYQLDKLV